jgi:hypothetical protein
MNYLKDTAECIKSELDIFLMPPLNVSIEQGQFEKIKPTINEDETIEFNYIGTDEYIDLTKCYVDLRAQVYKVNNNDAVRANLEKSDTVGPVNNFFHSLFSQIEVKLNNTSVENTNTTYPYKAYLTDLLNYSQDAKESLLQSTLFVKDRAGYMNNINANVKTEKKDNQDVKVPQECNTGFWQRKEYLKDGIVNLCGRLHCDIFNSDRYLLNKVNINIMLKKSSNAFCLLWMNDNTTYQVSINKIALYLRKVTVSPSVANAHNNALMKSLASYPIKRTRVSKHSIGTASGQTISETIYQGVLPTRVVLGMVANKAFIGNNLENPFNFQHFNISKLELKCSGALSPYKEALEFDFDKNVYMSGFRTLFDGIDKSESGNNISRHDYANGYTLFAFDFTPDMCSSNHFNIQRTGSLTVDMAFSQVPSSAITLIVYYEFDDIIYFDKNRQVMFANNGLITNN